MPLLPVGTLATVADHHQDPVFLGGGLGAADQVGEERVGHVHHHDRDLPAAALAKLAGGVVAYIAQLRDRLADPDPGGLGDPMWMVEHVADRPDRYAGGT